MSQPRRRKPPQSMKPQMTSLVDILTILLVFLIKSFSSDGEIMVMDKNLDLPVSSAAGTPVPALIIGISRDHILAGGFPVARVDEESARKGPLIPTLMDWLVEKKAQTLRISEFDESVEFEGQITIQGDRKIPYWILQKVLRTCGEAGYNNFSLAVVKKE